MNHPLLILASLVAVYIPVLVSPGPNFLVVTQAAINRNRRHAVYTALGIASGSTVLALLAATSVGLLLSRFAWFERTVQVLGGAYLLYVGVKIWRGARQPLAALAAQDRAFSLRRSYWYGMATNLSNPKALVFFATIFATLLAPSVPLVVRISGVVAIGLCSTVWHVTLANWFSATRMQDWYRSVKPLINRGTAVVLVAVALELLWRG